MTKSKSILLTLRPVDYYFFGGENTFDSDPIRRNYLVRSNKLPQQTGLLGLIRHVLFQEGMKIGDASFSPAQTVTDFGDLERLSPLFMQWEQAGKRQFFYPAARLHLNAEQELKVDLSASQGQGLNLLGGDWENLPHLSFLKEEDGKKKEKTYSEKEHLNEVWVSADGTALKIPAAVPADKLSVLHKTPKPEHGIFYSNFHIGIDKASRMKAGAAAGSDENGFYKQEFYRLAPGFSFAVKVDFKQELDPTIFKRSMPFGGENRCFILEAEPWTAALETQLKPAHAYPYTDGRVVLLSDAFISYGDWKKIIKLCHFTATQAIPFRNLQLATKAYENQSAAARRRIFANLQSARNSNLLHLLERGSVLFPKAGEQANLLKLLEAANHFQAIGYNHIYPSTTKSETI